LAPFYPTASELHRAAECVAPWALGLPETEEAPGEWAAFGRRMHEAAERLAKPFTLPAEYNDLPTSMMSHVEAAIEADRAHVGGRWDKLMAEQGVAWRPGFPDDEAKLVQREPGERLRGRFSGTVDLAYVRADGVLVVVDWKFGPREHINGEPAQDSCQGFFLALALCTALEIRGSSSGVVVARFERRMVREDGIEVDAHDITQSELDAWAKTLAGLARRIDSTVDAAPKLSAACGKCRAKQGCPAWGALEVSVLAEVDGGNVEALCRPPMSQGDARALYYAIEAAEGAVANWREWVRAWCLLHPEGIDIGLGLKLKAGEKSSRAVVQTVEAMTLIESVAGPNAIETKRKSSLGAIEKAVKEAAGAGIVSKSDRDKARKKAVEDAFARLTEGGAILEKGARWGVSVVRSDGSETVWMKGEEE
jgi:hypothetical protein